MSMMDFSFDSLPILTIENKIKNLGKNGSIDLQPEYQRGYIWINEFKDKLIYSIIRRYPIGAISFRILSNPNEKGATMEVVDGQQRLQTIYDFLTGNHIIKSDISRDIIKHLIEYIGNTRDSKMEKLLKAYKRSGKITLGYEQLPTSIQDDIKAYNISITNITNATHEEIAQYFRFLQNQERLRAGEIINSLPETTLEKYLNDIENLDMFLKKITFPNTRKQFDKIFYSILGLLDGAIGFGTMDKAILDYASECKDLSNQTKIKCYGLIEQLKSITNDSNVPVGYIKANARCMKFLLLIIALGLVDFKLEAERKLAALGAINEKLSAFSSAKASAIETAFHGYSPKVVEENRLIALISKGGHSFKRVQNRMEILAYYVNNFENKTEPSGIVPI